MVYKSYKWNFFCINPFQFFTLAGDGHLLLLIAKDPTKLFQGKARKDPKTKTPN